MGHFDPWITKGLAYQATDNYTVAHESFDKALHIAEKLRVANDADKNTHAQLIYIKVVNAYIENKKVEEKLKARLLNELNQVAGKVTSPNALSRVMLAYIMLEQYESAKPIYQRMGSMCPGFIKDPLLKPLEST